MTYDVIVAGAGPTGLMLAGELALGGARVAVLERLAARTGQSKALNLQPRSAEVLASRGLLDDILVQAPALLPHGHFAGIPLDYSTLDTPYPFQVGIPQARVEERLAAWATSLGAELRYGTAVTTFAQDDGGVTVDGERAAYLVGCDGARSVVRKQAGVDFVGRDARVCALVADVTLAGDGPAGWELPAPKGDGMLTVLPLGDGVFRMLAAGPVQAAAGRDDPIPDSELADALARDGLTLDAVRWASRFTDATRQAARYRRGRILLAGDAAHIHSPAGGQGLNLGLQDAFNLGWKLAEVIRGESGDALLDTYHAERHPVAARVLQASRAQGVLYIADDDVLALRAMVTEFVDTQALARRVAGLDHGDRIPGLDLTRLHDGRRHVIDGVPVRPDGFRWSAPASAAVSAQAAANWVR
ncbi:2-polyprenyl-6-methoxyphenol hydroxylase [Actinoplanes sp. SE50]|uniref:FAD-dependent monooxygenase n=1 Tax=unclassified Actinoplanes TaxID=2626549 RepID=UPI00023ECD50|nr:MULTISPECIES: FAD-dependent monooxygenase [unclassified Actinoplanes]AEV86591.1 2-polyprenyl-6-methoxyphenol hydroxylase [Actinoplanes sp. SE50/110]ATO84989.1 2-polyprenyl-6-methoxyphenol hydroxylase [Actinoplanes sp. SE50]SLM02398.1 2-polyprenyl-6-methoxyphenol hydroxylase [Actinoplanes sp. SE50/110]